MHFAVLRPPSERLSFPPEQDTEQAPQQYQTPVCHDRGDKSSLQRPWRDELAKTVTPNILVDGDADEERSSHRLVAVDSICGDDGREGRNLHSYE